MSAEEPFFKKHKTGNQPRVLLLFGIEFSMNRQLAVVTGMRQYEPDGRPNHRLDEDNLEDVRRRFRNQGMPQIESSFTQWNEEQSREIGYSEIQQSNFKNARRTKRLQVRRRALHPEGFVHNLLDLDNAQSESAFSSSFAT